MQLLDDGRRQIEWPLVGFAESQGAEHTADIESRGCKLLSQFQQQFGAGSRIVRMQHVEGLYEATSEHQ